jgi:hypothetical protein
LLPPQKQFLHVACLREGTGVQAPDLFPVVETEESEIVHGTPIRNGRRA